MYRNRPRSWSNWAGTVRCEPSHCAYPVTLEEIQAEVLRVAEEGERLRVVGSGLSFTPLCWSDENQMALDYFSGLESVDSGRKRAWVRAGTTLHALATMLADKGLALENLGDVDTETLGGAIATGAHGTGLAFGSLSTQVTALRMVCTDGSVRHIDAESDRDLFDAARLSLGILGVITHVELRLVDAYRLHYRSAKAHFDDTLRRLEEYVGGHRNFEFFWFPYARSVQLRIADETSEAAPNPPLRDLAKELLLENGAFWALSEVARRVPRASERISRFSAWAMPGADQVREAHRAYATRRLVRFNEIEYAIPLARLSEVLRRIEQLMHALKYPVHFPLHVRFVKGDDIWLSPGYQRDAAYIAAHTYRGMPSEDYFAALAEIFDRAEGRPHWAKVHDKAVHELASLYPRFDDFCRLRQQLDPHGVLLNPYLAGMFGVEGR